MSQVQSPTEPGWRPDPSGRFEWRYWDGGWTNRVANSAPAPAGTPTPSPEPAPRRPGPDRAAAPGTPLGAPGPHRYPRLPSRSRSTRPDRRARPAPVARHRRPRAVRRRHRRPSPERRPRPPDSAARPWQVIVDFFRSFADQPESYHSDLAREPLPTTAAANTSSPPRPGNYGHADLVAVAACGVVIGAYLPWVSGTIGIASSTAPGFDHGLGARLQIGAIALAVQRPAVGPDAGLPLAHGRPVVRDRRLRRPRRAPQLRRHADT